MMCVFVCVCVGVMCMCEVMQVNIKDNSNTDSFNVSLLQFSHAHSHHIHIDRKQHVASVLHSSSIVTTRLCTPSIIINLRTNGNGNLSRHIIPVYG